MSDYSDYLKDLLPHRNIHLSHPLMIKPMPKKGFVEGGEIFTVIKFPEKHVFSISCSALSGTSPRPQIGIHPQKHLGIFSPTPGDMMMI